MKFSGTTIDVSGRFRREADRLRTLGVSSDKALQRASGTLLRRLPVEARRDIQREYNLSTRRIKFDLHANRAGNGVIDLVGKRRRIGLIQYGGRWNGPRGPGASVQIRRDGGRESWDVGDAFIAVGLSGNRHIFERIGAKRRMQAGRYAGQIKQPIDVQHFGSIADFLIDEERVARLTDFAQTVLAAEMNRLLRGIP